MKLALAQINTIVGDLRGNANKVSDYCRKARDLGASLVVFPELTLTGYPPLDLLESVDFVAREQKIREETCTDASCQSGCTSRGSCPQPGTWKTAPQCGIPVREW